MRTTFTIDDDLLPRLKARKKEAGTSFGRVVNDLLRAGLAAPAPSKKRLKLRTFKSRVLVGSLDNVAEVLDLIEGVAHR